MNPIPGYILSRDQTDSPNTCQLRYGGISESGPFIITVTNHRPLFFIHRQTALPAPSFHSERRPVELTDFFNIPVDALYFQTLAHYYKARQLYERLNIRTFEADVPPEARYLMERFIHGGVAIHGTPEQKHGVLHFHNPTLRACDYKPSLSTLSLDIETGRSGKLYSIGCHYKAVNPPSETGLVLMLDEGVRPGKPPSDPAPAVTGRRLSDLLSRYPETPLADGGSVYRMPTEKHLLQAFFSILGILDPDILIGWHVIGFDLKFIERKCREFSVPFALGRDRRPTRIRDIKNGVYRLDMCGRVVIDGPPALRGAFYSFDNFRLDTVAAELLGLGKDIALNGPDKVAEIERRFHEDKTALATYNLRDCTLVTGIFEKTGLLDHLFKRALISGLPMDRVGMSVAAFDHYMLPQAHRKGLVAPNVRDVAHTGHASGGFVFSKDPGFYHHVVVLDFKSLYPSIIRTFHIDPVSRLHAGDAPLKTPVGTVFSRTGHVLPAYITTLMKKREQAKKDRDPHLSKAIKILMNSFYGVMGTPGCRFYHPDLPTSITGTGQWVLKHTRNYLEKKGYGVIYGDTDSVFVCLKADEISDPAAPHRLVETLNAYFSRIIHEQFGAISRLELEFEKYFVRFFLPSLRGGEESAKKRYAGMVKTDGTEKLVITGLEFVRSDWTRFARDFQFELFERIFQDQAVEDWLKQKVSDLRNHVYDADLVYKKRLTKPPRAYTRVIPQHVKAALLLGKAGENAREIRYVMTLRGPMPVALPHDDLDYAHYIDKQIKPIFDSVMGFLGTSYHQIFHGQQLTLF